MQPPNEEDFWEDLISLINDGKVIPVIGERAVTTSPGDSPHSRTFRKIRTPSA